MPDLPGFQIKLTDDQTRELIKRIDDDYSHAIEAHTVRIATWAGYYRRWANLTDLPKMGDEKEPNFRVRLVQAQILVKIAKELDSLLGEEAEVIAEPVGPEDHKIVGKVGKYVTWRLISDMNIVVPLSVFDFRRVLFGRTHAYLPWEIDRYRTPKGWQIYRQGPVFQPIAPDDIILPPIAAAQCIHDFPYAIRRYRDKPTAMVRGEEYGLYQNVKKNLVDIQRFAESADEISDDEVVARQKAEAEGVIYDTAGSGRARGTIEIHEWYSTVDWGGQEREVVVRYLPDKKLIVGVQDLMSLYPTKRRRIPIVEGALIRDGSYWSMGFGKMLSDIEDELSVNHQLFTKAGQFSVGPVIFARPMTGFNRQTSKIEPYQVNWTEDPSGVTQIKFQFDPQYSVLKDQMCRAEAERLTGQTDQSVGRSIDRPNAPRTATGQVALLEEGNIRASYDVRMLREDMRGILKHIWELECDLNSERTFFRVTEEDAGGLFRVSRGGSEMMPDEFAGRYDFDIKFATSRWSREAHKDRMLTFYQLALGNPLLATNPNALWWITNELAKALGFPNFHQIVPKPPDMGEAKHPREEWTLALQAEDLAVHPSDDDQAHLLDHYRRIEDEKQAQNPDVGAIRLMLDHIAEQQQQLRHKQMMQQLMTSFVQDISKNDSQTGGLNLSGGTPMSIQQLQENMGSMFGPQEDTQNAIK